MLTESEVSNQEASSSPTFKCSYGELGEAALYDVQWYIDNDLIKSYENVPDVDTKSTYLREDDWVDTHQLNMKVKFDIKGFKLN